METLIVISCSILVVMVTVIIVITIDKNIK
jgi:hypothetical protein